MVKGLRIICFWLLVIAAFCSVALPFAAQPAQTPIRGVWMTSNDLPVMRDRERLGSAIASLKAANFNRIYPVVWNSGYVKYPSATARATGIQPFLFRGSQGQDILGDLLTQAHQQGMLVIPWFEFGFMTPPTSELAINRPNWLTRKRDRTLTMVNEGGEVVWLNPFLPEVQNFITNLVLEVITNYNVDGVQFDDHMSLPRDFGYDDFTVNLFRREAMVRRQACQRERQRIARLKPNPKAPVPVLPDCSQILLEVPANPDDPQWVQWRADKLSQFMVRLHDAVKSRKPRAIFSVSPNYYDFAYKLQLQDWLGWVRRNIVDELIVQVYRSDLASFLSLINRPEMVETQQKTNAAIAILTGLRTNGAPMRQIQPQVQATLDRNFGISFFYFGSLWSYGPEPISDRQNQFNSFFQPRSRQPVTTPNQPNPFIN